MSNSRVMLKSRLVTFVFLMLFVSGYPLIAAEACNPEGEPRFVCGTTNPEDLLKVPGSPWVIASGRYSDTEGPIYAVNVDDHSVHEIYPANALPPRHNQNLYAECPGPAAGFQPHGLTLRTGSGGEQTLFVVGHGPRETVEVFTLDRQREVPALRWIGCVPSPEGTRRINSITTLPDGTLAATNFDTQGGELWEWLPGRGWVAVPGSSMPGPNGLLSSADGQWYFIGGWSDQALIRLSRGVDPEQKVAMPVGFNVDNIRWAPDGSVIVAGHVVRCPESETCETAAARVARVNPETGAVQQLIRYAGNGFFALGTVAIEVDDEIWIGGINGTLGIARFPR